MDRRALVALALSIGTSGCAGVTLGDALRGIGGQNSALRGPAHQLVYGPTGPAVVVNYRGGPNESLALETCAQCSSPWPDDLFKANGNSLGFDRARDDRDITSATAPLPGVEPVPLAPPTWCDGYRGQAKTMPPLDLSPIDPGTTNPLAIKEALRTIAFASCDRQHYLPRQKHVVDMLQAWLNVTRMPLADVRPTLRALASGESVETPQASQTSQSGHDPAMDALTICDPEGTRRPDSDVLAAMDRLDILDAQGKLTSLDRAAAVCGGGLGAVSAIDMTKIDWDKAKAELAVRGSAAMSRALVEKNLFSMRLGVQQAMSRVDPKELATAEAAYAEWFAKTYPPEKALFDLAFTAIDRARGDADPKGCGEPLRGEVASRIKARKLRNVKEADNLWDEPALGVLLQAQALCDAVDRPLLGSAEVWIVNKSKRWFGPRRAALYALKRDAPAMVPTHKAYTDSSRADYYEIKSVTPKGDQLLIVPNSDQRSEAIMSCHDNNHIDRILPDGSIRYKEDCVQTGTTQIKNDYAPILVSKEFADLLKPGRWALIATDAPNSGVERSAGEAAEKQKALQGYPISVYPDTRAMTSGRPLLYYYGVRLP